MRASDRPTVFALSSETARWQRRKHNKTFTGCTTCKRRRINCDEGKPSCVRCLKAGHPCEYKKPVVWRLDENKSAEVSLAPKDTILMGKIPQSEKRALAFYIDRVSPVFSAYFGKSFWSSIVLQLSHENNLVRSALLCASSLFQSFELPANSAVSQREFYHSYSLAMKSLRDADSRPSTEIVLTACLLFTSYEFILGSFSQGLVHHRSGFKIAESRIQQLREERRLDTPEASFLLTHIKPILNDYALQAAAYGAVTFPTQEQVITPNERHELPYTPKSFPSLHVAHHCLSGIVHHITISEATLDGPWDTVMARQVRECLDQWPLSLMEYARTRGRSSIELEKRQLVFLDCNHQLATLLFEELVSKDATEADVGIQRKASSYRGIISRFQEVEQDDKATREAPGLDNYIEGIIPLFVIAVTAEDKQVRSEALSLLGSMKRKEANWDSEQAFKIAQVIIQLERRALSKKDVDFKDTSRSDIQAIFRNDTLPCLHTSSVQWPLGRVLPLFSKSVGIEEFLESCSCKAADRPTLELSLRSAPSPNSELYMKQVEQEPNLDASSSSLHDKEQKWSVWYKTDQDL